MNSQREHWLRIKILLRGSLEKSKKNKRNHLYEWFKGLESVRSGQLSHVPSELAVNPLPIDARRLLGRPRNSQPDFLNTHGISGNVSCKFTCVLFSTLLENNPFTGWPICGKSSYAGKYGNTRSWNEWSKQRRNSNELHFDKFHTPQTFSCWKIGFNTGVCSCSNSAEAMLWIKEVELTNSVDDLKSSCSTWRTAPFSDLELLDARIASARNKMIQNSYLKKNVSLEEQKAQTQDRFLRGTQIAYLFYDYFRVTFVNECVLDYVDCFAVTLRNDNIQEFDTMWDEIS